MLFAKSGNSIRACVALIVSQRSQVETMLMCQSPAIDVTRVENRRSILPIPPVICSHKAGWENICLEYYQLPAFEIPAHYQNDYTVVIHLHMGEVNRRLGECFKVENIKTGDIAVIPPGVIHSCTTTQKSEFIILILSSKLIFEAQSKDFQEEIYEVIPHFAKPDPLIHQIGVALKATLASDATCSYSYAESMATALAAHLVQNYSVYKRQRTKCCKGLPLSKLLKVNEFIFNHLAEELLVGSMASEIGMSKYHFARLFKQSTGMSPYQYLIKCRIERAKILLRDKTAKISEVASTVGFSDQSQFTRHFKRLVGATPQEVLR
ncbi:AraC family transcriptional regulator [Calothrix sp. NIES-4071]|nr:AraC family transcriptional regulator [Calothrix sp. NIES-4071]BAZ62335.1 AraC family transcriptional regulator [Calothrix sp. NIES-4105]